MTFIFRNLSNFKLTPVILKCSNLRPLVNMNEQKEFSSEEEKARKADRHEKTVFEKIVNKELKADIIFEDHKCLAFNDINPQAPVHFLVIPKQKIAMLDDVKKDDTELLGHLLLIAKSIGKKRLPNGYRVVINNGIEGSQSVYYLHVHVLGGRQMRWPPG